MHYYLYISALQARQIKCETQKAKMSMQKRFPPRRSSRDNQEEAMEFSYSPGSNSPGSHSQNSYSPASPEQKR